MNILFDYDIFARQKFGGISRYYYELIEGLSKKYDINVELFLGLNNSGYNFNGLKNVIVKEYKYSNVEKLYFLFNLLNEKLFERYVNRRQYSLLHKTYYSNIGSKFSMKKVMTVHDMTHELYPQYFAKSDNTSALKKRSIDDSDGIICVSETTKNDLMNKYEIRNKLVKVIYHGIPVLENENMKNIVGKPYILYVGQRWGYKNFNFLLKAYNLNEKLKNNICLVCFGGGRFNFSERLYIKKNKLEYKVIHIEGDDGTLSNLYIFSDVFVNTSIYEGFGFPPLEAMKLGCPVLTASAGSVKEVAGNAALYYESFNTEEFMQKLFLILDDTEFRKQMIVNGYERAKLYSWDKCTENHISFYKELINL